MYISTLPLYSGRTQCNLRSEPSSRTSLTGEQPDPWDLLQPQDEMSRHRTIFHIFIWRRLYLLPVPEFRLVINHTLVSSTGGGVLFQSLIIESCLSTQSLRGH